MLNAETSENRAPMIFCLHYLGGSAREWDGVAARVRGARVVAIDLPGFGDSSDVVGFEVAEMATFVEKAIRAYEPVTWYLAGHSMGAKVTSVLTRRIEDNAIDLPGLQGVVLLAGSPPCPEPMDEAQRAKMLGYFTGDAASCRADAERFVADNTGAALDIDARAIADGDALRANRAAWVAWLERGSCEDWAQRVGVLTTPALILAGADDSMLGPNAQRSFNAPHYANARLFSLHATKHLLPLERPREVAGLLETFVRETAYRALIGSARVSARTRRALEERGRRDDPTYRPKALSAKHFATLKAMVGRVVPQPRYKQIDLAARIDTELHARVGDGWRFDALPTDCDAYRSGLATLDDAAKERHGIAFSLLDAGQIDAMLAMLAAGALGVARDARAQRLDPHAMTLWFEDVRAAAVRAYMSHPDTFARIGYSGIAYGGDGEPKAGFARVGVDEREAWEPIAAGDSRA